jgi:hypothetical protein
MTRIDDSNRSLYAIRLLFLLSSFIYANGPLLDELSIASYLKLERRSFKGFDNR